MNPETFKKRAEELLLAVLPVVSRGIINPQGIREDVDTNALKREQTLTALTDLIKELVPPEHPATHIPTDELTDQKYGEAVGHNNVRTAILTAIERET